MRSISESLRLWRLPIDIAQFKKKNFEEVLVGKSGAPLLFHRYSFNRPIMDFSFLLGKLGIDLVRNMVTRYLRGHK